jgi:hypothetical protein
MKRLAALIPVTLIAAALPLAAGTRISVDQSKGTETTQQEILFDATRIRINSFKGGDEQSVLFLTDGGRDRLVILDTKKNEYTEIDRAALDSFKKRIRDAQDRIANMGPLARAVAERKMRERIGDIPDKDAPKPVYTSKGGNTVNGFACANYEGTLSGKKVSDICAARPDALKIPNDSFDVFARMRQFASELREVAPGRMSPNSANIADSAITGFPVIRTQFDKNKIIAKSEVKKVEPANFSDADFSLGSAKKRELKREQ